MRRIMILLSLLLALAWSAPALGAPAPAKPLAPSYNGCGGDYAPVINTDYEALVVYYSNQERVDRGLPPLKHVNDLDEASRYHATDMAQDRYEAHETYDRVDGKLQFVCDTFYRMSVYYTEWLVAAENISGGLDTPKKAVTDWMASPGHRANILSSDFWEIGAGYYYNSSSKFGHYWVQEFGRRQNRYPLIINNEAPSSDVSEVELYVYGDWSQIRLSNDGATWSEWRAFQNQLAWDLGGGVGEHTVYAEMRDGPQTASSQDKITLTKDDGGSTTATLGGLPQEVVFFYNRSDGSILPSDAQRVAPRNTGTEATLSWNAVSDQSWILFTPSQGTTPGDLTIIPYGFDTSAPATHSGNLTVTVTDPASGVDGTPHTIRVSVVVMDGAPKQVYLSLVAK